MLNLPLEIIDKILILNHNYRLLLKYKRFYTLSKKHYLDINWAVKANNIEYVKYLLKCGRNIRNSKKTIKIASKNNYIECLELLLKLHCNVNYDTIYAAIRNGNIDALKLLINSSNIKCNSNCLNIAINNGYLDIVKYIIEIDVISIKDVIDELNYYGYLNVIKLYIEHQIKSQGFKEININDYHSSVYAAILHNNINFIKFLVKNGYKLSAKNISSIELNNILTNGKIEMVEYFLEIVEPVTKNIIIESYNEYLEYHLKRNNVIFDSNTFKIAKENNHKKILDILKSKNITINRTEIQLIDPKIYNLMVMNNKINSCHLNTRFF